MLHGERRPRAGIIEIERSREALDAIVLRMTGLADPAPVANTFFLNAEIADYYRIDSILCLADAKHIAMHMEEEKPSGR